MEQQKEKETKKDNTTKTKTTTKPKVSNKETTIKAKKTITKKSTTTKKKVDKRGNKALLVAHPKKVKLFLKAVSLGMSDADACRRSGIAVATIQDYKWKGNQDLEKGKDTIYSQFMELYNNAYSSFIEVNLQNIMNAGLHDWRASHALLKMRDAKNYGDKQEISINADELGIKIINDVKDK
ncbi:MAG: hypothetical protein QM205_05815 [Bacillota bacterium]|nr:hypothetical protein [Bacillota bacterium]